MSESKPRTLQVFKQTCEALKNLNTATADTRRRSGAKAAGAALEAAALALAADLKSEDHRAALSAAALTHSVPLVAFFGPGKPYSVNFAPWARAAGEEIARNATPQFLAALLHAGIDIAQKWTLLYKRAIARPDPDLHALLLTIAPRSKAQALSALRIKAEDMRAAPEFTASLIEVVVAAHPAAAAIILQQASPELSAALWIAGARPERSSAGRSAPITNASNHDLLQLAAKTGRLAEFLADPTSLQRSRAMLADAYPGKIPA